MLTTAKIVIALIVVTQYKGFFRRFISEGDRSGVEKNGRKVLVPGIRLKWLAAGYMLLGIGVCAFVPVRHDDFPSLGLFGMFAAISLRPLYHAFLCRISCDDQALYCRSPLAGFLKAEKSGFCEVRLPWAQVHEIGNSFWLGDGLWLRSASSRRIRIPYFLRGYEELLAFCYRYHHAHPDSFPRFAPELSPQNFPLLALPAPPRIRPEDYIQTLPDDPALAPYRDSILATARPSAEILLYPVAPESLTVWQSKLGGMPYLPLGSDYPFDASGQPMHLLMQINCAEMPPLPGYPSEGILQFYISQDWWGLDFDHPENPGGFRVLYHPQVLTDPAALHPNLDFLSPRLPDQPPLRGLPFHSPCAIQFAPGLCLMPLDDVKLHFSGHGVPDIRYGDIGKMSQAAEQAFDAYADSLDWEGSRIGGYPDFIQEDWRVLGDGRYLDYILLLQINSDPTCGVMWGDLGNCQFCIHPDDLARRDFSRVAYNWACT